MTDDNDVRGMLRRQAAAIEPNDGWDEIARRTAATDRSGRRVRVLAAAAALAVLVAAVGAYAVTRPERQQVITAAPDDRPHSAAEQAGASTTAAATEPIWPVRQSADLTTVPAGLRAELKQPWLAAERFLEEVLGDGPGQVWVDEHEPDAADQIVAVPYRSGSPDVVTGTVVVHRAPDGDYWYVTAADDSRLAVDSVSYDGSQVDGQATPLVTGEVHLRVASVDGRDPVVDEKLPVRRAKAFTLRQPFAGKPGVVLTLALQADKGAPSVTAIRLTPSEPAPQPPAGQPPACSGATVTDAMLRDVAADRDDGGPDVPVAVQRKRDRIVEAARRCDIELVAALTSSQGFQFSFGDDDTEVADYWAEAEAQGEPVMRMLVLSLHLESAVVEAEATYYVWPAVAGPAPQPRHWDALADLYPDDAVDAWRKEGNFYGYRAGFTADGQWVYFVAGD